MTEMITGVHGLIYSKQAELVRAFLRDKLGWSHIDSGGGWLIFALPPTELAVHPTDGEPVTELYLMCDDIAATRTELEAKGVEFAEPITNAGFGLVSRIRIAEGETLGIYEPRHPSPLTP
jgi:predicted enzyme related to lactoylglutathione lyase